VLKASSSASSGCCAVRQSCISKVEMSRRSHQNRQKGPLTPLSAPFTDTHFDKKKCVEIKFSTEVSQATRGVAQLNEITQ
jgi:hypothetical protein